MSGGAPGDLPGCHARAPGGPLARRWPRQCWRGRRSSSPCRGSRRESSFPSRRESSFPSRRESSFAPHRRVVPARSSRPSETAPRGASIRPPGAARFTRVQSAPDDVVRPRRGTMPVAPVGGSGSACGPPTPRSRSGDALRGPRRGRRAARGPGFARLRQVPGGGHAVPGGRTTGSARAPTVAEAKEGRRGGRREGRSDPHADRSPGGRRSGRPRRPMGAWTGGHSGAGVVRAGGRCCDRRSQGGGEAVRGSRVARPRRRTPRTPSRRCRHDPHRGRPGGAPIFGSCALPASVHHGEAATALGWLLLEGGG
jgi:hypothetical protein